MAATASKSPAPPAQPLLSHQRAPRRTTMGYMPPEFATAVLPAIPGSAKKTAAPGSHRIHPHSAPTCNEYLQQKWDYLKYEDHRRKVHASKPAIDNKPPKQYMHIHVKLKKVQQEEERLQAIEKGNRALLERMARIMKTRGAVDNVNEYEHISIGRTGRQRELQRITIDNQHLLRRIQDVQPQLKPKDWAKDYAKSRERRQSISRYQEQQWEPEVATVDAQQFPPAQRRGSKAARPSLIAHVAEHQPAAIAEGLEEEEGEEAAAGKAHGHHD